MKKKLSYQFWAIILILIGVIISGIYILLIINSNPLNSSLQPDINKIGAFGEFIGGVIGSLWSLAGVFLFFQALKDQQKDVETNIQLLKLQIEDLEISKKSNKEQAKILKLQQFETTFFSLFNFYSETTKDLEFSYKKVGSEVREIVKSKKVFSKIVEKINDLTKDDTDHFFIHMELDSLLVYKTLYDKSEEILQTYFGALYRVLKFIDSSDLNIDEQYIYSNTVRDFLSNSELIILHYHRLICSFTSNFSKLLKKYNILLHLPISIRPEFKTQKKKLEAISKDLPFPVDLHMISEKICGLIEHEFFKIDVSSRLLSYSGISIWVYIVEKTLEVKIKIPTQSHLNDMYSEYKMGESPYYAVINKYRDYNFCGLIEQIVYSRMILDNYYYFTDEIPYIYKSKREIYETQDKDYKVFKCIFEYKDKEKLMIPLDLDNFKSL